MWENMFYFFPASLSKSKLKLVLHTVDARNLASEMFNPCQLVQDFFHQTIWDGEWRMDLFFWGVCTLYPSKCVTVMNLTLPTSTSTRTKNKEEELAEKKTISNAPLLSLVGGFNPLEKN